MPHLTVNGIEIYYESHGAGEPLLFISGLGGNTCEIAHLAEAYSRHARFISLDNRGCGRSGCPPGEFSIPGFADDAAGFIDALGLESAFVYGSSMGGMIAQEMALRHPERVRGLILGCTTGASARGVHPSPEVVQTMIRNSTLTPEEAMESGWSLGFSREYIEANRVMLTERAQRVSQFRASADSYHRQVVAAAKHDAFDRLHQIACPVMIVHGADDLIVPAGNARLLKQHIPHAELHILEGAGHGYNLEAQEHADALVIDFVRRHSTVSTRR